MALQLSTAVNNALLDIIEATIGASPTLRVFSGTMPANTDAANSGTVLATILLPSDWMQPASGGTKAMAGTWRDNEADAAGNATHYRIFASDGTCMLQGTTSLVGGGGNLQLDNVSFQPGQEFSIVSYVWRSSNS